MKPSRVRAVLPIALLLGAAQIGCRSAKQPAPQAAPPATPGVITVDYPVEGTIFPPEFPAPTWLFRDTNDQATAWEVTITFSDGAPPITVATSGARLQPGPSDPRCFSASNHAFKLAPEQAAAHTWVPDEATWAAIKTHSATHPATVAIRERGSTNTAGQVSIQTSSDPVGAPIFYRDVPLMPSESEKGVIKPLAPNALPLIAWRLRNIAAKESQLMMEGLHSCANCHSFSADGKTLGLDMDGPLNDKGLYALVDVRPRMSIRNQDLIAWSNFRGKLGSKLRVGFMSQVSPDGRHVITTVNDPGIEQTEAQRRKERIDLVRNYYVANFKDYRFLQVFYPTRGVLVWYRRDAAHLEYLPGADDTRFVQANAVWSPDGKYLVFARAEAKDAYPAGVPAAQFANDPNETQMRFDLYRVPFNGGKGGKPEPIVGASKNGMSNSFPKVSPDGKWIVFVEARNGLLMRPDGQLYIVPAKGGVARRMNCNTALMNSWHSFSPNGRWMVFASKSRSPYTQMYLTHIDAEGNDSPAVLIENATAANRAVNIPEFVSIPADGMQKIETPAAEYARHVDLAIAAMKDRDFEKAIAEWTRAIELSPSEARPHNNLGVALAEIGKTDEAIAHYRQALALNPEFAEACNNLGEALAARGAVKEAISQFEKAVHLDPDHMVARTNLGVTLAGNRRAAEAIPHLKKVVEADPHAAEARRNLGHALAEKGDFKEASVQLEEAVKLSGERDAFALYLLSRVYSDMGKRFEAEQAERKALSLAVQQNNGALVEAITSGHASGR